nr:hypothetical protein [Tanacetum cinerariifolium]
SDSSSLESRSSLSLKRGFEKVVKTREQISLAGILHSISSSKVTSHLLGIGKRFSALDSVTSLDSVSGELLRTILQLADKCRILVVVLDWFLRQHFIQKSSQDDYH